MRRILRVFKNLFFTKTPTYVFLFVTSFCNARCKMCFNWKNVDDAGTKEELTLDEIKKIFDSFSGIQQLTITGGEPFLREDLPQILEYISAKNDVQMVTLPTNGILSDRIFEKTGDILRRIRKSTHLRLGLSVEGIGTDHDEIVQVKGAFDHIKDTYHKLYPLTGYYKNFNIDIALCMSAFNKNKFRGIIRYCNDYFKDCTIEIILSRGDARDELSKDITRAEYQDALDYFYHLGGVKKANKPFAGIFNVLAKIVNSQVGQILDTKKMPSRCYAYSKLIVLQSNGDVYPCEYLNKNLGNLRDYGYDIKKILNDSDNREIERFIKGGKCHCTWECALINNIVCNLRMYPLVLKELLDGSI